MSRGGVEVAPRRGHAELRYVKAAIMMYATAARVFTGSSRHLLSSRLALFLAYNRCSFELASTRWYTSANLALSARLRLRAGMRHHRRCC